MQNLEITKVTDDDFDSIYQLLEQLWPDREMNRDRINNVFTKALQRGQPHYCVARTPGKIIGFISWSIKNNLWAQGNLLHIDDLVVEKTCRRQKIGSLLLREAEKFARDNHCAYLELDSGLQRTGAHSFYEKNGFSKRAFNFIYQLE